jgi:uncharacterized protein (DUF3820 family)
MGKELTPDPQQLVELLQAKMPFGKYAGRRLLDLPEAYLVWFRQKGFPAGKLGLQLEEMLGMKENGLEPVLRDLARKMI